MVRTKTETVQEIIEPTTEEKKVYLQKNKKEIAQDKLNEFMKEETKTVRGRFRCYETPGASQKVTVRKYKDIPMFEKTMTDGEMYEIPLYAARFLNGTDVTAGACECKIHTCSYPVHGFKWDKSSTSPPASTVDSSGGIVPLIGVAKRNRRYGFESMEFDV
jgi:hypothetical protein